MIHRAVLIAMLVGAFALAAAPAALAQTDAGTPAVPAARKAPPPIYRPPLRGAPGGRVGGASRSALVPAEPLPTISLIAPADHTGLSESPEPSLYFFISRAPRWPTEVTIAAPGQAKPVLETTLAAAPAAGIYQVPLGHYHVQLQPGILYTWSVAVVLDPHDWSRNIVASATIMRAPPQTAPADSVGDLAAAGLWYDAVAAAVAQEDRDGHAALDALMQQVGLDDAVAYDRRAEAPRP